MLGGNDHADGDFSDLEETHAVSALGAHNRKLFKGFGYNLFTFFLRQRFHGFIFQSLDLLAIVDVTDRALKDDDRPDGKGNRGIRKPFDGVLSQVKHWLSARHRRDKSYAISVFEGLVHRRKFIVYCYPQGG